MFLRHNIAGILWAILILILCVLPGSAIPHYRWTDLLSIDKIIHAFLFIILTLLLIRGFKRQTRFSFLNVHTLTLIFLFSVIYGGLLELMQNYCLADRTGSWFDLIANVTGCILGIIINNYLKRKELKLFGFGL
ncbi:MAG TPA: VanZ family protein [Bacteroidia bacterium]|nr:VanZ family protein [Bacteroidia bacterium]